MPLSACTVKAADDGVPLDSRQIVLVLVVVIYRAKGTSRRTPTAVGTIGRTRVAVKLLAIRGKCACVLIERRFKLMAFVELIHIVRASAC
jgi:hypothetical protein